MKLEFELSEEQLDAIAERVAARAVSGTVLEVERPWTADELARETRQHPATIRRAVHAGRIRRVPGTARILIPAAEVRRIMEGRAAS